MKMSTRYLGVISVALVALLNAGCGGGDKPEAKATGTRKVGNAQFVMLTGDAAAPGMPAPAAYTSASCSTCHGPNGEGSQIATEIRHTPTNYSNWVVRNGRIDAGTGKPTSMIAFPDAMTAPLTAVSAADLAIIQGWLQMLPRPMTPENMYFDYCANCHGKDRTGGSTNVALTGVTAAQVRTNVRAGVGTDPAQRDAYMPAFSPTDVTDAELEAIIGYIGAK